MEGSNKCGFSLFLFKAQKTELPLRVMSIFVIPIAIGKKDQNKATELGGFIFSIP